MKLIIAIVAAFAAWATLGTAEAKAPMSAFGDLPAQRAATLSPDGTKVAYIATVDTDDILMLHDLSTHKSRPLARVSDVRPRALGFVGDNYVILIASKTTSTFGFRGRYEFSAAFAFNIATGKIVQLLRNTRNLYPAQSGLGNIVAADPDGRHVFMPAYMGFGENPPYSLLRVDLDTGRGSNVGGKPGNQYTVDWIVAADGKVLAREDLDSKDRKHTIFTFDKGEARKIFFEETALANLSLSGVSQTSRNLIVLDDEDTDFYKLFEMSPVDGTKAGPIAQRADADIDSLVIDQNRVVHGVRYSGMQPSYEMFDKTLDADIKWALKTFPISSVSVDSWSADWSKVLLYVSGGARPERYILLDRPTRTLTAIINLRPEIRPEDVGQQITIKYKARDGLEIPGLITWPVGVPADQRKNLPLVVLPHGGPHAYDSVGFDWLAQFIANEGYAVLQPNFRGSDGFGVSFAKAGVREWGRKMQDDITDGVDAMSDMGWIDKSKACIVGWSYGGYAALAGGALTPDRYKCVVAVAGVSDLIDMLNWERATFGPDSRSVIYWNSVIGDPSRDRDAIEAVSPARRADAFKAPILLVHGTDDTTVPSSQSDRMHNALKSKGKEVTYIKIKGDDHSLVDNESRRQMLTALGEFLARYLK